MPTKVPPKEDYTQASTGNYGQRFEQAMKDGQNQSIQLSLDKIVEFLEKILGQRLLATMVNTKNHKLIGQWKKGQNPNSTEVKDNLRQIYHLTYLLKEFENPITVRAWFLSMNPDLDDKTALELVQSADFAKVLKAIKSYIAKG